LDVFPCARALIRIGNPAAYDAIYEQLDTKLSFDRQVLYAFVLDEIDRRPYSVARLEKAWQDWRVPGPRRRNLKALLELCRQGTFDHLDTMRLGKPVRLGD
jgi:hypothetical protein